MYTVKKFVSKENKEKYIKKNCVYSNQKNKYKQTSLEALQFLPKIDEDNFVDIFKEFDESNKNESYIEKIEILDDGSVVKKTKSTTRLHSPTYEERYFDTDFLENNNFIMSDNLINNENHEEAINSGNNKTYVINKENLIYNKGMIYNKSSPNIKTLTYTKKKKANVYIPQKPYNSGKKNINIKSKGIKNNEELNYKRVLFNKNENFDYDIINQWKYFSKKCINYYNQILLKKNIQIIIQKLKKEHILKGKEKYATNLKNIINQKQKNLDLINKKFFDDEKIKKYKGKIESINEEMYESNEEQEEESKINSKRSNKNKDKLKINKKMNEFDSVDKESISFSPISIKSKDIKFNINNKNLDIKNKKEYLIYKKKINDKNVIKLLFNENNNDNINQRYILNIKSYKKILKMAFNTNIKKKVIVTKENYESLILRIINNFNKHQNKFKNNNNINNELDKEIIELEKSINELKNIYIYGIKNIQNFLDEKSKNNFIKNLNLTKKRNNVKRIYNKIISIVNNKEQNSINYYKKIFDILKKYEEINENELNIKDSKTKNNFNFDIKKFLIILPIIFALNYFVNNFKKI